VPMMPKELEGRPGRQPDGSAKTREIKLGCVFTQTHTDPDGHPVRDWNSSTYVTSFCPSDDFGGLVRSEAVRRGLARARRTVVLADGAPWVWELARVNFPAALQILDFYHAADHLHALAEALHGEDSPAAHRRFSRWKRRLLKEGVPRILREAKSLQAHAARPDNAERELAYIRTHRHRMRYPDFRRQGLFIGSGAVEAGCKTVVAARAKQSGMRWSLPGAHNLLALRALLLSHRLDAFYADLLRAA